MYKNKSNHKSTLSYLYTACTKVFVHSKICHTNGYNTKLFQVISSQGHLICKRYA